MSKDPVCGMEVNPQNAVAKSEHSGRTYHFCSVGCKRKFDQNPAKFAKEAAHVTRQ